MVVALVHLRRRLQREVRTGHGRHRVASQERNVAAHKISGSLRAPLATAVVVWAVHVAAPVGGVVVHRRVPEEWPPLAAGQRELVVFARVLPVVAAVALWVEGEQRVAALIGQPRCPWRADRPAGNRQGVPRLAMSAVVAAVEADGLALALLAPSSPPRASRLPFLLAPPPPLGARGRRPRARPGRAGRAGDAILLLRGGAASVHLLLPGQHPQLHDVVPEGRVGLVEGLGSQR
mmetsp:Transcript_22603/g.47634  ORF Transcript_22603/g.47634 Transcript_22603/m.47634 type:complete len:234 (-) Transcript_22603:1067-1768(-)